MSGTRSYLNDFFHFSLSRSFANIKKVSPGGHVKHFFAIILSINFMSFKKYMNEKNPAITTVTTLNVVF